MSARIDAKSDPITLAMRVMRWISTSDALDRIGARKTAERLLYRGTRAGFRGIAAGRRQFAPLLKLAKPSRLPRNASSDLFDLNFTEEQEMLRDAVRRLVNERVAPQAHAADEACAAPAELLQEIHALGLNLIASAEATGGMAQERPIVTNMLMAEELARGDMGVALAALAPIAVINALNEWGSAAQQSCYLPPLLEDQPCMASIAVAEPYPGEAQLRTVARRTAQGYRISGEKSLVIGGASAEFLLVAARVEGEQQPALFIVEAGTAGLSSKPEPAMGVRAAATARLRLDDVQVPASARLGEEADVFDFSQFMALSRMAWNALACGTAEAVRDYVIPYVKERSAFGEPVAHRQGVAFMVADIGIELDGMRLANWRAAALAEQGKDARRAAYLAHILASEKGMQIGTDGVQLLGGHGFVKEHPVERWYRNLRAVSLAGTGIIV